MSALGRLVAAVALDTAEFTVGTDRAKYLAAQMAGEVDRTLKGLENSVKGTMGSIAAALGAGLGIAAIKSQFDAYVEGAAKLQDLSAKAGVTVQTMSGLAAVAKLSGTSMDDLAGGLEKLSRGMVNAAGGTGTAGKALEYLGISTKDSSGRLKDAGTVTEEVAAKMANIQDGAAKTAIAMDLYGKAGANLIPVLKDIAEYGVQNATITSQQAAAAKGYEQDLIRLGMAKSALVKIISSELIPVGDAMVRTFLNMQTQAGGVRDKAKALAEDGSIRAFAMSAVDLMGLVINAGDSVSRLFQAVGEEIAYLVARTANSISSLGAAMSDFIQGNYKKAWADVVAGTTRDASIVEEHGNAMRGIFEKPLAGDTFVASVKTNLAIIDQEIKKGSKSGKDLASDYGAAGATIVDVSKQELESMLALIKALDQLAQIGKDYAVSVAENIDQYQFEASLIGKTSDQVAMLTAMRKIDSDARHAGARISQQDDSDTSASQGEVNAGIISMAQAEKDRVKAILDGAAASRAQQAEFQAQVKEMDAAGDAVGKFFGSFATSAKSAVQIARDELKKLVADLIALAAKKIFLNIIANAFSGTTLGGAAATAAGNAGANTIAGSVLNVAGSFIANPAGAYAGFMSGASEAAIGADFVGPSATLANGAVGYGATAGAAAEGSGLITAEGALSATGWGIVAAAAIAIIAAIASRHKGGPKTGGSYMGAFDANGLIQNIAVPGTDNGRFFTPDQFDPQVQGLVGATNTTYRNTIAALGGKGGAFSFGLGLDNDPNGTAQSRVSSMLLDSKGNSLYKNLDQNMDDKAVPAALQLESSRMILAALKASDLPAYLSKVFDGLTVSTATQQQINDAMNQAIALKNIFDVVSRNPMKDIADAMSASQNALSAAMKNNEAQVRSVMKAYDGTLATTQALQQATVGYYNAQLQLIAGIAQVKQGIDDMFGNTIRNFKLAGLGDQGKYDFYKNEAADLQRQALGSSDPETIRALSQRINDDLTAAFNLLTPEQQAGAEGQSFISGASATQSALDARLEKIEKDAVDATQTILNEIKDLIGANTDSQTAAANTQLTAANTNLTAATTPRTLIVQTNDGSQEVVTFQ